MSKRLVLFCCLFMGMHLSSCIEYIDNPRDHYSSIETEEAMIDYLNGTYAQIEGLFSMYNLLSVKSDDINLQRKYGATYYELPTNPFANDFNIHVDWPFNADNIGYEGAWIFTNFNCVPEYADVSFDFYRTMYRTILMANKVIHYINVEQIEHKEESWNGYLGEAYFLRAYLYFKLARVFGRVPLVTDIYVNYDIPLAQFMDIYSQIENDLITAISYLPENKNSSRKGAQTPHQGTAKVLLAEVYLTMGGYPVNNPVYYTKAAETAREVIDNANAYGFGLMDDYANLWQWQHHNNKESVWSIYYRGEDYKPKNNEYRVFSQQKVSIDKISAERNFFRAFPNNYRKEISFWHYGCIRRISTDDGLPGTDIKPLFFLEDMTFSDTDDFYGNVLGKKQTANFSCYSDSAIKTAYPPYKIILERSKYAISKKLDSIPDLDILTTSIDNYLWKTSNDPRFDYGYAQFFHILRYAHTLLTYAEASARAGNPDALTYEAVNMVRRRANKLPLHTPSVFDFPQGLSGSAFADSVVKERSWEFCHEFEGRWNDIIRLQLFPQIDAKTDIQTINPLVEVVYQGQTYFIPLPQTDSWLNPNIEPTSSD